MWPFKKKEVEREVISIPGKKIVLYGAAVELSLIIPARGLHNTKLRPINKFWKVPVYPDAATANEIADAIITKIEEQVHASRPVIRVEVDDQVIVFALNVFHSAKSRLTSHLYTHADISSIDFNKFRSMGSESFATFLDGEVADRALIASGEDTSAHFIELETDKGDHR